MGVPLQLAGSTRCVMVGDDRQLPPTVFSAKAEQLLLSRPLFERLRKTGHTALLLDEQYRMAPEISAFPRSHFYGGALRDAPGMLENTRRAFHAVFPPLLFFDLQSSAQRANGSWKNVLCDHCLPQGGFHRRGIGRGSRRGDPHAVQSA